MMYSENGPIRVGIGGPVGSGKTALMEQLCQTFRDVITFARLPMTSSLKKTH